MPCASQYSKLPLTRANVSAGLGGYGKLRWRLFLLWPVDRPLSEKEFLHRRVHTFAAVGVVKVLGGSNLFRRVRQQHHAWRFMRHHAHAPAGITRREIKPDLRPAAGCRTRRPVHRRAHQSAPPHRRPAHRAADPRARRRRCCGNFPRVIGHDGVAAGEVPRDIGENPGILRAAGDDQQGGAGPLFLIIDAGARHFQRGEGGIAVSPLI